LVGVVWRSFFEPSALEVAMLLLCTVLLFGVSVYLGVGLSASYVVFAILMVLIGITRTEFAYQSFFAGRIFENKTHVVEVGQIIRELDVRDEYTYLTVRLDGEGSTILRVKVSHYPSFTYGERVSCEGEIHIPTSFETDTGRTFAYEEFLMKDGIHYELRNAHVTSLHENAGNKVVAFLLSGKAHWLDAVSQLIPEPSNSLLGGVVVGAKQSLGDEWLKKFRDTGIIHIVVLSGYNLTLVANSISHVTAFLPSAFGLSFGILGVLGFALLVGGGATVVRVSIMAIIGLFATTFKRPYVIFRALLIAAMCMVLYNPFVLAFDPGFQLSFLATLGLVSVSPILMPYLSFVPVTFGMREIVSATLATQIAVLPLLLYQVGSFSLVAPFVNVLVLPVIPFVMFFGFLMGLVGMVSTSLAFPFSMALEVVLLYVFKIVTVFSSLSYASMKVPELPLGVFILLYIFLFSLFLVLQKKEKATQKK